MQIDFTTDGAELSDTMREQVERRLRFHLTRYAAQVRKLEIQFGGDTASSNHNRRVRVRVRLNKGPDVVVEDVEPDLDVAVDRAIGRAARSVGRRLSSSHQFRAAG